ncbi:hypothetical protein ABKN59_005390 [Abortiporus biennis]
MFVRPFTRSLELCTWTRTTHLHKTTSLGNTTDTSGVDCADPMVENILPITSNLTDESHPTFIEYSHYPLNLSCYTLYARDPKNIKSGEVQVVRP